MSIRRREKNMERLESVDEVVAKYAKKTTTLRRRLYVAIGSLFVGFSFIGIFVPGWPTVSWMVPAAYLFSLSDERFFRWTLTNSIVGDKVFEYYANGKTLPRHAKNGIIGFITLMSVRLDLRCLNSWRSWIWTGYDCYRLVSWCLVAMEESSSQKLIVGKFRLWSRDSTINPEFSLEVR
tara:strand:+ start:1213 stop:1749 length:537 start_codon:yes stop_codon:yes gene_type:complete